MTLWLSIKRRRMGCKSMYNGNRSYFAVNKAINDKFTNFINYVFRTHGIKKYANISFMMREFYNFTSFDKVDTITNTVKALCEFVGMSNGEKHWCMDVWFSGDDNFDYLTRKINISFVYHGDEPLDEIAKHIEKNLEKERGMHLMMKVLEVDEEYYIPGTEKEEK